MMEKAIDMVARANARARKAEDRVRILAGQLEETQRQMMPSDGTIDVPMSLEVRSRKGKEREESPYDGGDEGEEEEV
jgi:hypothetical protein